MKLLLRLLVGLIVLTALCVAVRGFLDWPWTRYQPIERSTTVVSFNPQNIVQIEELELLVLPYGNINDFTYKDEDGRVVGCVSYMFNGIGKLTLNMKKVKIDCVSNGGMTNLVVHMPRIEATGARVFHSRPNSTNAEEMVSGIIGKYSEARNVSCSELDRNARMEAQREIQAYMLRPENLAVARERASAIIHAMLDQIDDGGEVVLEWPVDPVGGTPMKDIRR